MDITPLKEWMFVPHNLIDFPCDWNNCDGHHLYVKLPNGSWWDIDSRAANCSAPWDKFHRCWVRYGSAPFFTVKKENYTCDAGGGSVLMRSPTFWHGFLRNGNFIEDGIPPGAF